MKDNLKILAILFSAVLNVVLVGSHFYHGFEPFWRTDHEASPARPLYEELDLSRGQLDRFAPLRDRFHTFVEAQGRRIKATQLELIDLLAREPPDRLAIETKREESQSLQRQMQSKVIDHLLEESRILTPEQRRRFFALIRGRLEKSDGPQPRWMPKDPTGTSQGQRR